MSFLLSFSLLIEVMELRVIVVVRHCSVEPGRVLVLPLKLDSNVPVRDIGILWIM